MRLGWPAIPPLAEESNVVCSVRIEVDQCVDIIALIAHGTRTKVAADVVCGADDDVDGVDVLDLEGTALEG